MPAPVTDIHAPDIRTDQLISAELISTDITRTDISHASNIRTDISTDVSHAPDISRTDISHASDIRREDDDGCHGDTQESQVSTDYKFSVGVT